MWCGRRARYQEVLDEASHFRSGFGVLAAAFFAAAPIAQALAADPSGVWLKEDGSGKIEVKKCGRGICGKVVWLRDPIDSRGKPLHDARNENASMRDRPTSAWCCSATRRSRSQTPGSGASTIPRKVTSTPTSRSHWSRPIRSCSGAARLGCCAARRPGPERKLAPAPVPAPDTIEVKAPGAPGAPDEATPKPAAPMVEAAARGPDPSARPTDGAGRRRRAGCRYRGRRRGHGENPNRKLPSRRRRCPCRPRLVPASS